MSAIIFFIFFGLVNGSLEVEEHKFYVSQIQVNYNSSNTSLEVSAHIFIDDLEMALEAQGADSLFIGTKREVDRADTLIFRYLQQQIQIRAEGKLLRGVFVGKELSDDLQAIWCYWEIEDIPEPSQLEIDCDLLTEVLPEQKNIIQYTVDHLNRSYFLLHKSKTRAVLH